MRYPRRQPINAPQGKLAQSDAGFARFLKDHSSPKHHRVTAGGRIVPMDLSPPPVIGFKASLGRTESEELSILEPSHDDRSLPHQRQESEGRNGQYIHDGNFARLAGGDSDASDMMAQSQVPLPNISGFPLSLYSQGLPILNPTQPLKNSQLTTDGAYPLSTNKMNDSLPWYPSNYPQNLTQTTIPQNVQMMPQPSLQSLYSSQLNTTLGPYGESQNVAGYPCQITQGLMPNQILQPGASILPSTSLDSANHKRLEEVIREYELLSDQLVNLDRYLALHGWDIDQDTKKSYVDQRVEFVRKLDAARSLREQLELVCQSPPKPKHVTNPQLLCPSNQFNFAQDHTMQVSEDAGRQLNPYASQILHNGNLPYLISSGTGFMQPTPTCSFDNQPNSQFGTQPFFIPDIGSMMPYGNWNTQNGLQFNEIPLSETWETNQAMEISNRAAPQADQMAPLKSENNRYAGTRNTTWDMSMGYAPPEIMQAYRKMENAAKRGEQIEPYIAELAKVTARIQGETSCSNDSNNYIRNGERKRGVRSEIRCQPPYLEKLGADGAGGADFPKATVIPQNRKYVTQICPNIQLIAYSFIKERRYRNIPWARDFIASRRMKITKRIVQKMETPQKRK